MDGLKDTTIYAIAQYSPWVSLGISVGVLLLFVIAYKKDKARVLPGALFILFMAAATLTLGIYTMRYGEQAPVLMFIAFIILLIWLAVFLLGALALVVFLLINARIVFKREKHSLANSLSLILAIAIIAAFIVSLFMFNPGTPKELIVIQSGLLVPILFYLLHAVSFVASLILCGFARPKDADYVVVLGSGLFGGKVTPLLGGRIDRAVKYARAQAGRTGKMPALIMSGGQGADEERSEAEAMCEYAEGAGISKDDLICEGYATNTFENMKFSKKIMDERSGGKTYRCVYATNGYHLLRAGMFARKAGLNASGIGAKTARYFVPNAVIREYIAYLMEKRKRFIMTAGILFAAGAIARIAMYALQTG